MSDDLYIHVVGLPKPQGSKDLIRAKLSKAGKLIPARMINSGAPALKRWRDDVHAAAKAAAAEVSWEPIPAGTPVRVVALFALPKPASAPKTRRTWPCGHVGDVDKLARAVLDSLTGVAFADDCQVVGLITWKDYPGPENRQLTPGVLLRISVVTGPPSIRAHPEQTELPLTEGDPT